MTENKLIASWYVLHTKNRFENTVTDGLNKKSIEVFFPKVLAPSKRRDRKVMIRIPLFPGYLFVKTNLKPFEHLEIIKTIGAVRLIGNKDGPIPVPENTVDSLKIMVTGDNRITTGKSFKNGDQVIVTGGPFAGVTGTFISYRSKKRVFIHIKALGQYAGVEVSEEHIKILRQNI